MIFLGRQIISTKCLRMDVSQRIQKPRVWLALHHDGLVLHSERVSLVVTYNREERADRHS